jgi:hypothetical protein
MQIDVERQVSKIAQNSVVEKHALSVAVNHRA